MEINLENLFANKTIKAKAKVKQAGDWLLDGEISVEELLAFTKTKAGTDKASCIEAFEYVPKRTLG